MSRQDHIDALVQKALWFDRLKEMGMLGGGGRLANAEACRVNGKIKEIQKKLEIDNRTLSKLKNEAKANGELY